MNAQNAGPVFPFHMSQRPSLDIANEDECVAALSNALKARADDDDVDLYDAVDANLLRLIAAFGLFSNSPFFNVDRLSEC